MVMDMVDLFGAAEGLMVVKLIGWVGLFGSLKALIEQTS